MSIQKFNHEVEQAVESTRILRQTLDERLVIGKDCSRLWMGFGVRNLQVACQHHLTLVDFSSVELGF